jgi:adenylosuccinate lyase
MTDPASIEPTQTGTASSKSETLPDRAAATLDKLDAETAANVAVARERVHTLGHDLEAVAHWLVATTRGAIRDVGDAIRWIGSKI